MDLESGGGPFSPLVLRLFRTPQSQQSLSGDKERKNYMNRLIQFKRSTAPFLILLVLACFALLQKAQAVSPAPDGGYPGFTTAEGSSALQNLITGVGNTAAGWHSLFANTAGNLNTAVGAASLHFNTADQNTATGAGALLSNSSGSGNTAVGAFALLNNTTGLHNTATGLQALLDNTTGEENTANGVNALASNTTGNNNTATGFAALFSNTTGHDNTAVGFQALSSSNTTAHDNAAVGSGALVNNTSGQFNTAVGSGALNQNTTGNANTALGALAGANVMTATGVICIGAFGADVSSTCFISNIRDVTTQNSDAIPVLIDSNDQLGTASSSRRYKTDIKPMDKASESILALKPVSFRYKVYKGARRNFGLIAEDVAKVNPNLVIYDRDGKPYTVRYDAVNAMLLNEFLKEHRTVQEQSQELQKQATTIAKQQKQIEALAASLQKVSAQLGLNKPAPQTVVNNR